MADLTLTMSLVLEEHLKNIISPQTRRINLKVKRICKGYMDKLEDIFLEHGIYNKLESLSGTADYLVLDKAIRSLEGIDCLLTNLMLCTDKK